MDQPNYSFKVEASHIVSCIHSIHPTVPLFPQSKSQFVSMASKGLQNLQTLLSPASRRVIPWPPCSPSPRLNTQDSGPSHCCSLFQENSCPGTFLDHSLTSFIFLVSVILVRPCQPSSCFWLIFLHCIFNHVKYFSICLLSVFLQVKYMLLKGRNGIRLDFTAT